MAVAVADGIGVWLWGWLAVRAGPLDAGLCEPPTSPLGTRLSDWPACGRPVARRTRRRGLPDAFALVTAWVWRFTDA
jgi:hypothetical protein